MHYETIKDAALCTALATSTRFLAATGLGKTDKKELIMG